MSSTPKVKKQTDGKTNREVSKQHESPLKLDFVTQTWGGSGQLLHDEEFCGSEVVIINLS